MKERGSNRPAPKLRQLLPYELWGLSLSSDLREGELGILNCSSYKRPQPAPLTLGSQQSKGEKLWPFPECSTRKLHLPGVSKAERAALLMCKPNSFLFRKFDQAGTVLRFGEALEGEEGGTRYSQRKPKNQLK